MTVIDGPDHDTLRSKIAAVFGGSGTTRHIGKAFGRPRLEGWKQHLWTGMPGRGSARWTEFNARTREAHAGFVVVVKPSFYSTYDHFAGELLSREGEGARISVLTLALTHRPRE